jgi:hypothetical protein
MLESDETSGFCMLIVPVLKKPGIVQEQCRAGIAHTKKYRRKRLSYFEFATRKLSPDGSF